MNLPIQITMFLEERQRGVQSPCASCNSTCCKGPGFAVLENVLFIYDLYVQNQLIRDDYVFEPNLSLSQFINKYFDRTIINGRLLAFFPKVLSENNKLISIPPWNFWEARDYILKRETSYGCIFLKKKNIENSDHSNRCILHNSNYNINLTQKPIDCLFLYCQLPSNIIRPTDSESALWFSLLDYHFQNSINNFNQLCPDLVEIL